MQKLKVQTKFPIPMAINVLHVIIYIAVASQRFSSIEEIRVTQKHTRKDKVVFQFYQDASHFVIFVYSL